MWTKLFFFLGGRSMDSYISMSPLKLESTLTLLLNWIFKHLSESWFSMSIELYFIISDDAGYISFLGLP